MALWSSPGHADQASCEASAKARGLSGGYAESATKSCTDAEQGAAQQVKEHGGSPIATLQLAGSFCASEIIIGKLSVQVGSFDKVSDSQGKAHGYAQQIDDAAAPAVKAAKRNADLVKAVKEFYQAAAAYCANGIPLNRMDEIQSGRLESEFKAKQSALDLEVKLSK